MTYRDEESALREKLALAESKVRVAEESADKLSQQLNALRGELDAQLRSAAASTHDEVTRLRLLVPRLEAQIASAPRRSARNTAAFFCFSAWVGAAVFSVASGFAGCAHDIEMCSECRTQGGTTPTLAEQCNTICTGVGMRQVAHFDHETWYSCSCLTDGRWCEFHSDHSAGDGAHMSCSNTR